MTRTGPVKICQMITELAPAGAEKCVYQLATMLPKDKFEVHVVALKGGKVADDLEAAGIKTHVLGLRCRFDLPKLLSLKEIFRREKFQLLHTHLFHAGLVGGYAAKAVKIPHIVHSIHIAEKRLRPLRFWWTRFFSRHLDKIICVSEGVKEFHSARSGISPDNYEVIYNGIDTGIFKPDSELRQQARTALNISDDKSLCLFLGRLDRQKGVATLLDAFLRAAASHPKLVLAIAGSGPLTHMVTDARQDKLYGDRIISLGFRDDVAALLNACDFLCMPSRWEGFGLSAAEAMACGKAVIVSDVDGLNEVVSSPREGILVPPGDADVLAASMGLLAASGPLRNEMGQAGRDRIEAIFTINKFIDSHAELYSRILQL